MERRFAALRVIGTVSKVLGWIVLILGILVAIVALVVGFAAREPLAILNLYFGGPLLGVVAFVVLLTLAISLFLLLYGAGEFLYAFLSMEESSRRTAYILQQQFLAQPPGYGASMEGEPLDDMG